MKLTKPFVLIVVSLVVFNYATSFISVGKHSPQIGEIAPQIELPTPINKSLSLSSLRGKIVLVDFWASWCAPCRLENRLISRLYRDYKNKNFMVYSVSLDSDKTEWINAIQKDKLIWGTHVSDLQGWASEAALVYKIEQIPTNYLINEEGKIVAMNLRGEELENHLRKYLK